MLLRTMLCIAILFCIFRVSFLAYTITECQTMCCQTAAYCSPSYFSLCLVGQFVCPTAATATTALTVETTITETPVKLATSMASTKVIGDVTTNGEPYMSTATLRTTTTANFASDVLTTAKNDDSLTVETSEKKPISTVAPSKVDFQSTKVTDYSTPSVSLTTSKQSDPSSIVITEKEDKSTTAEYYTSTVYPFITMESRIIVTTDDDVTTQSKSTKGESKTSSPFLTVDSSTVFPSKAYTEKAGRTTTDIALSSPQDNTVFTKTSAGNMNNEILSTLTIPTSNTISVLSKMTAEQSTPPKYTTSLLTQTRPDVTVPKFERETSSISTLSLDLSTVLSVKNKTHEASTTINSFLSTNANLVQVETESSDTTTPLFVMSSTQPTVITTAAENATEHYALIYTMSTNTVVTPTVDTEQTFLNDTSNQPTLQSSTAAVQTTETPITATTTTPVTTETNAISTVDSTISVNTTFTTVTVPTTDSKGTTSHTAKGPSAASQSSLTTTLPTQNHLMTSTTTEIDATNTVDSKLKDNITVTTDSVNATASTVDGIKTPSQFTIGLTTMSQSSLTTMLPTSSDLTTPKATQITDFFDTFASTTPSLEASSYHSLSSPWHTSTNAIKETTLTLKEALNLITKTTNVLSTLSSTDKPQTESTASSTTQTATSELTFTTTDVPCQCTDLTICNFGCKTTTDVTETSAVSTASQTSTTANTHKTSSAESVPQATPNTTTARAIVANTNVLPASKTTTNSQTVKTTKVSNNTSPPTKPTTIPTKTTTIHTTSTTISKTSSKHPCQCENQATCDDEGNCICPNGYFGDDCKRVLPSASIATISTVATVAVAASQSGSSKVKYLWPRYSTTIRSPTTPHEFFRLLGAYFLTVALGVNSMLGMPSSSDLSHLPKCATSYLFGTGAFFFSLTAMIFEAGVNALTLSGMRFNAWARPAERRQRCFPFWPTVTLYVLVGVAPTAGLWLKHWTYCVTTRSCIGSLGYGDFEREIQSASWLQLVVTVFYMSIAAVVGIIAIACNRFDICRCRRRTEAWSINPLIYGREVWPLEANAYFWLVAIQPVLFAICWMSYQLVNDQRTVAVQWINLILTSIYSATSTVQSSLTTSQELSGTVCSGMTMIPEGLLSFMPSVDHVSLRDKKSILKAQMHAKDWEKFEQKELNNGPVAAYPVRYDSIPFGLAQYMCRLWTLFYVKLRVSGKTVEGSLTTMAKDFLTQLPDLRTIKTSTFAHLFASWAGEVREKDSDAVSYAILRKSLQILDRQMDIGVPPPMIVVNECGRETVYRRKISHLTPMDGEEQLAVSRKSSKDCDISLDDTQPAFIGPKREEHSVSSLVSYELVVAFSLDNRNNREIANII